MTPSGSLRFRGGRKDEFEMNTYSPSDHGQSAQILQFPVGGRRSLAGHRATADGAELLAQRVSDAVGGAWYHEAAIREAAAPAKS
jgi:hypothetical protein